MQKSYLESTSYEELTDFFWEYLLLFSWQRAIKICFPLLPTFQSTVAVKTGVWTDMPFHQDLVRHLCFSSVYYFVICLVSNSGESISCETFLAQSHGFPSSGSSRDMDSYTRSCSSVSATSETTLHHSCRPRGICPALLAIERITRP